MIRRAEHQEESTGNRERAGARASLCLWGGVWIRGVLLLLAMACGGTLARAQSPAWPGCFDARVEVLALLQTLNADLLSHDSATATLEHWCEAHRLASPPRIVAARVADVDKPPSLEQRRELGVTPTEAVRYRRVRLMCGALVLSEADNWYVPSRLTPAMNALLDTTEEPFGRVVQALNFRRHTLSARLLWLPLPEGWEMNATLTSASDGAAALPLPAELLQHRAVLSLPDGTPFSEVVETYTNNVLAFAPPERLQRKSSRCR
jgi:hypothetical protein